MPEVRPHGRDTACEGRGGEALGAHSRQPALDVVDARISRAPLPERGQGRPGPAGTRRRFAGTGAQRGAAGSARRRDRGRAMLTARDWIRGGGAASFPWLSWLACRSGRPSPSPCSWSCSSPSALPARARGLAADRAGHVDTASVVSRDGRALVTYHARGKLHRVLAWGARERGGAERDPPAGRLRARLLGRVGPVRAARVEDAAQRVRAVPRACAFPGSSRRAPRRTARTGRSRAGGARRPTSGCLRGSPATAHASCGSRTGAARPRVSRSGSTGATAGAGTTSSGG